MASQDRAGEAAGETGTRDFLREQGALLQEGFSFSGYERDLVALNRGDGTFLNISGVSGADSVSDGRAAVFADLDNDGDLDLFLRAMHGPAHFLFRNEVGHENRWLRVILEGTVSGRDAWGATVKLETSRGSQAKTKAGGDGFLSQSDPRLLFGLGGDEHVERLEVTWPSGAIEMFENVPASGAVKIVEGMAARPEPVTEARLSLPDPVTDAERRWQPMALAPGDPVPPLPLQAPGGAGTRLDELVGGGRPALVNFWATWCVPCRTEMPELEKLHRAAGDGGLRVIGISADHPRDRGRIRGFLDDVGVTYPVYTVDPEELTAIFAVERAPLPTSLVVDGDGRVTDVFTGWSRRVRRHLDALRRGTPGGGGEPAAHAPAGAAPAAGSR